MPSAPVHGAVALAGASRSATLSAPTVGEEAMWIIIGALAVVLVCVAVIAKRRGMTGTSNGSVPAATAQVIRPAADRGTQGPGI